MWIYNNGKLPSAEKFISNWIVRWIFLSHKTSKPFLSIRFQLLELAGLVKLASLAFVYLYVCGCLCEYIFYIDFPSKICLDVVRIVFVTYRMQINTYFRCFTTLYYVSFILQIENRIWSTILFSILGNNQIMFSSLLSFTNWTWVFNLSLKDFHCWKFSYSIMFI